MLSKTEKGQAINLYKNCDKIWEIVRQYNNTEFLDDESSLGCAIDVYQESINKTAREYLVNFKYFQRVMENYGFTIITDEEASSMGLPSGTGLFS